MWLRGRVARLFDWKTKMFLSVFDVFKIGVAHPRLIPWGRWWQRVVF